MHEAVARMLTRYEPRSLDESFRALREIIQEIALLGLWRAKFFEHAAFYGGTALRILYGLDRFSEDLDFSLLQPSTSFKLERFTPAVEKELLAFGFNVKVEMADKSLSTPVHSAFLKANTRNELLVIETDDNLAGQIAQGQVLKVKIEVDSDPPPGFSTKARYCCNLFRSLRVATNCRISLPARCTRYFAEPVKIMLKDGTGMILSGMRQTIPDFI